MACFVLNRLGIAASKYGYRYIECAIELVRENRDLLLAVQQGCILLSRRISMCRHRPLSIISAIAWNIAGIRATGTCSTKLRAIRCNTGHIQGNSSQCWPITSRMESICKPIAAPKNSGICNYAGLFNNGCI